MSPRSKEIVQGLAQGVVIAALLLVAVRPSIRAFTPAPKTVAAVPQAPSPAAAIVISRETVRQPEFGNAKPSANVRQLANWVVGVGDNGQMPFAIIDKVAAHLFVFDRDGRLTGDSAVLLGSAAGDDTVPGIGERAIRDVAAHERTTPAGRFVAEPGRNAGGESVIWVDYGAAVSMHRVRLNNPSERRLQRLLSQRTDDNRISYGCINVPVAFFETVIWPRFGQQRSVVYVLPERKPLAQVFPAAVAAAKARPSAPAPV